MDKLKIVFNKENVLPASMLEVKLSKIKKIVYNFVKMMLVRLVNITIIYLKRYYQMDLLQIAHGSRSILLDITAICLKIVKLSPLNSVTAS